MEKIMEPVAINAKWCKGCGICMAFCPKGALALVHEKAIHAPGKCIACGLCELYCPDLAIVVDKTQKPGKVKKEEAA
jgi:2-oxoglutarate ferredoxin oxidoreductase subunit delta